MGFDCPNCQKLRAKCQIRQWKHRICFDCLTQKIPTPPIAWALFDDASGCISKALEPSGVEVWSIGNQKHTTPRYVEADLAFASYWHLRKYAPDPDIIFALPPCETWIHEDATYYFDPDKPTGHNLEKVKAHRLCASNTARIMRESGKPYCIQNPADSLIWEFYQRHHSAIMQHVTNCRYGNYNCSDNGSTRFATNFPLFLNNKYVPVATSKNDVSGIPPSLVKTIFEQWQTAPQATLF